MVASASGKLPCVSAAISMVTVATRPTPAARPSMPSMRLNALVQPTSQITVSANPNPGQAGRLWRM